MTLRPAGRNRGAVLADDMRNEEAKATMLNTARRLVSPLMPAILASEFCISDRVDDVSLSHGLA